MPYGDLPNNIAGTSNVVRRPTQLLGMLTHDGPRPLALHRDEEEDLFDEEDEDDDNRFINFSLLSHIAVQVRDKVPRGTHVKGSIPYPRAFTGKDVVVCKSEFFIVVLSLTYCSASPQFKQ